MSSLLFDDFLYRWFHVDGQWYYGSASGRGYFPFSAAERNHYLSRVLASVLTHDHIFLRIAQLEEFIDLVGISATLFLLQNDALIIIDDGGTFTGFLPKDGDNLLMNFSSSTALQFDAILGRLNKQYAGYTERLLLKSLIYAADKSRSVIDGAWLQHLTSEEDSSDLQNGRLIKLLEFEQPYDNIIVKDNDIIPLMRLNQANKSLIYQNELKITTLSTEAETQQIISGKYGNYFGNKQNDPLLLFQGILKDKQIPDLSLLYQNGLLSMKNVLDLRNTFDGRTFRQWLESEDYNRDNVYKVLLKSRKNLSPFAWQSLIRWVVPTIVGVFHTAAGIALSAVDNFIVSRLMSDWHPNLFLDEKLARDLDELQRKGKEAEASANQTKFFGHTIGRNDLCPCKSGEKFKKCCGKNS